MKLNRNNLQNFVLLLATFSLMGSMVSVLFNDSSFRYENTLTLKLAIILIVLVMVIYTLLIIKRINPKQYVYISYSNRDSELAQKIADILNEKLEKLSKYRFEIITEDSIPLGNDIYITVQENLNKSDTVIVIVSSEYVENLRCRNEFIQISEEKKKIIPIVTESLGDLKRLPKDISNIKALFLDDGESEEKFLKDMSVLARDLIRQRRV